MYKKYRIELCVSDIYIRTKIGPFVGPINGVVWTCHHTKLHLLITEYGINPLSPVCSGSPSQ